MGLLTRKPDQINSEPNYDAPADAYPTGDPVLDARRQAAIDELGRQLSPNEAIAVAVGDDPLALQLERILPGELFEPSPLSPEKQFEAAAEAAAEAAQRDAVN